MADGIGKIRKQVIKNEDVAAVIWHSPNFLLNIASEISDTLKFEGLQKHFPDVYLEIATGAELSNLQLFGTFNASFIIRFWPTK